MKFFYAGDQMLIPSHQHVRDDMQRQESVVSARTSEDGVFRRGQTDLPCHIRVHARVSTCTATGILPRHRQKIWI